MTQVNKIINQRTDIITDTTRYKGTQKLLSQMHANKVDNLEQKINSKNI